MSAIENHTPISGRVTGKVTERAIGKMMLLAFALLSYSFQTDAQEKTAAREKGSSWDSLALTPPMGWNSWNFFEGKISERSVKAIADAMAANGMKAAGYEYIVIDDLWVGGRDSRNRLYMTRTACRSCRSPCPAGGWLFASSIKATSPDLLRWISGGTWIYGRFSRSNRFGITGNWAG